MRKKGSKDKAQRVRSLKATAFRDRITLTCSAEQKAHYESLGKRKANILRDFISYLKSYLNE